MVEVMTLEFPHTKLVTPRLYGAGFVHSHAGTEEGIFQTGWKSTTVYNVFV